MSREAHVRFCERLGVKFPRPTHPYIRTWQGWLYLAVVIDLFSRKVVGWSMKPTLNRELALDALLMALWRRKPTGRVLVHSDQGSQYGSDDWHRFCVSHDLEPSMSRRGNCWDTQSKMIFERRADLTRAGIGRAALALTCRSVSGVPRALPGPTLVT